MRTSATLLGVMFAATGGGGGFDTVALVFGLLLVGGALVSGLVRRSFLSLTAAFVLAGFALGQGGLDVLHFDPESQFVADLATVALVVILFRDGLEVEAEMLQKAWHLPFRKLVLAMPLTAAIVAAATHVLTDLGWTECFLLGSLLAPTDPVLSSSVVTNPRVPRVVRHSLNLESGMNDGLALPAVLAFMAVLVGHGQDGEPFVWWRFVLQDVGLGFAFGIVMGLLASIRVPSGERALYGLGVAFATYGVTVGLPPEGNGLIAVFVAAITLGIRRPDMAAAFDEDVVEIVKLGIFVVFGSLLTLDGLFGDGWAAVAIVAVTLLIARPAAIWISLAGTGVSGVLKAFMAWFGPKGVATMTFSLLVLAADFPSHERIFHLAALCVFVSILAHGLTDTPGSDYIASREEARRAERPAPAP
jgi:sodium/hydrogen antiporter